MTKLLSTITIIILFGCASQKTSNSASASGGHTRTIEVESLDEETYLLTEASDDKSYGYKENNPIKVGANSESSGPKNERRFLNALLGPNGEEIMYYRAGSCCSFSTPNGLFNNSGLLDRYRITWNGTTDTLDIYINMYDKGNLKIPVGLTAKKR